MLPSGAALVPPLPNAPADRPEAPEPDASDSRFASLVAQFTLPPAQLPAVAHPSQASPQPGAAAAAPAGGSPAAGSQADAAAEAGKAGSATPSAPAEGSPAATKTTPEPSAPEAPAPPTDPALAATPALAGGAPSPGPRTMTEPLLPAGAQASDSAAPPVPAAATAVPARGAVQPLPAPQGPAGTGEAGLPVPEPAPRAAAVADETIGGLAPLLRAAADKPPAVHAPEPATAAAAPVPSQPPNVTVSFAGMASPGVPTPPAAAPRVPVIAAPGALQEPAPAPLLSSATPTGSDRPLTAAPAPPGGSASTGSEAGDSLAQETAAKAEATTAALPGHLHPDAGTPGAAVASARPALAPDPSAAPAAPPPAPAAPPPLTAPPVAQVDSSMKWMLRNGAQEARLQLHPDSLGQVTIHLRVEGGEVHAKLWVSEPASVQAVQEGRPHLELSLKEQGLQLGSFDLHQGHRPFQEATSTPNPLPADTAPVVPARQERPAAIVPTLQNPHQIELYA